MDMIALLAILALIVLAFFAGATVVAGKALKLPNALTYCAAPIIGVIGVWLTGATLLRCSESFAFSRAIGTRLTPAEISTLHREQFVCPTIYTFKRNGEKTCVISIGGRADVGCG